MLALGAVRRPALLRKIFAVAVSSPPQIVSLQKLQGQLQDSGALETVAHYLALLQDAYLIATLEKYSVQAHRRRASPAKLIILNNALLLAMHPNGAPDPVIEPDRFGFWVENACLAFAINQGQQVSYWREEPLEVDAILEGSWGKWAAEVKTGPFDASRPTRVLPAQPGVQTAHHLRTWRRRFARRHGIASVSWEDFLIGGPGGTVRSRGSKWG